MSPSAVNNEPVNGLEDHIEQANPGTDSSSLSP